MLTFSPMHRIVPTSVIASGDRTRSMVSMLPVAVPASKTETPLKTSTLTSFPLLTSSPTSILGSRGSPIRISPWRPRGTNRTRPIRTKAVSYVKVEFVSFSFITYE